MYETIYRHTCYLGNKLHSYCPFASNQCTCWWLSARLLYLQYISNGEILQYCIKLLTYCWASAKEFQISINQCNVSVDKLYIFRYYHKVQVLKQIWYSALDNVWQGQVVINPDIDLGLHNRLSRYTKRFNQHAAYLMNSQGAVSI